MLRKVEELFKPEIILSLNLGEIHMKRLLCLLLMGLVSAQNIAGTLPKEKEPFILTYYDIREDIRQQLPEGKIIVDFFVFFAL